MHPGVTKTAIATGTPAEIMKEPGTTMRSPSFFSYSLGGMAKLIFDYAITRTFFKPARIIRSPYYIRNKCFIRYGQGFTTGVGLRIDALSREGNVCIEIGENVQLNDYVHIGAVKSVRIGNNVLIASKVFITDHNHGRYDDSENCSHPLSPPAARELFCAPVLIEDNVWIGEFVSILPGVTIGRGSVIGTMSVVTKDIPPYSIAVGSPAKVIKQYNLECEKWERC